MGCCFGHLGRPKDAPLPEVPAGYGKKQSLLAHQQKHWAATGVVSLRESGLKDLPSSLQTISTVVKVIDVSGNKLETLPETLSGMYKLERLIAPNNHISQICQMSSWSKLKVLDLSGNRLTTFPDGMLQCLALEILKLSGNRLVNVPQGIEQLQKLKDLQLSNNSLQLLPAEIGHCSRLEHLDCSGNQLTGVPESLGELKKLRRLILNNNPHMRGIPSAVLQGCTLLHTLELHGTGIPRTTLQQTDGYESFEQRRQNKFSKAIDGNAMIKNTGLDEGIDVQIMQQG